MHDFSDAVVPFVLVLLRGCRICGPPSTLPLSLKVL
jgi:hypothetical protein